MSARRAALAVAGVALALLGLELAARVYLRYLASEARVLQYASLRQLARHPRYGGAQRQRYTAHKYLGYYPTPGFQQGETRHNALGYRGEAWPRRKPEGEFRIVCIGESTTYDSDVADDAQTYPAMLQRLLREAGWPRVRVINAGVGGWSTWESLANFEFRVLDVEPDLILIHHGMNDAHTRLVWPPAAYQGDNSGAEQARLEGLGMPPLWEYSTLLRAVMIRLGRSQPHAALRRTLLRSPDTYYADDFVAQQLRQTYPEGFFREVPAEQMLAANPPVYFQRNLEHLVALAQRRGVRPVLLTFPYAPDFNTPVVASRVFQTALAQGNEVLRRIARESRVPVYDLAAAMGAERAYYTDGYHTTPAGSRAKAAFIAAFLRRRDLLPRRAS